MRLYKIKDNMRLIEGAPSITFPEEVVGKQRPKNFVVKIAYLAPGEESPHPEQVSTGGRYKIVLKAARVNKSSSYDLFLEPPFIPTDQPNPPDIKTLEWLKSLRWGESS